MSITNSVAGVWSGPVRPRIAYVVAATIGLGFVLAVHGGGFVFGTSSYWDMPQLVDNRMYVMGYRYFVVEPWHWPVFDVHTNMPWVRSVAFSDTPLLWALLHKSIASLLPPWRDYSEYSFLGLWYGLVTTMQPVAGVACLRALGHRTLGAAVVTALFFIAIPAWTDRFPHASLYAHFIVLWALYLYLVTPSVASRRLRVMQLVQLAVATLLNAYLTVMSLAIFAAALMRSRRRVGVLWFAAGCAIVIVALAFAGYFAREGVTAGAGFSAAGSNLLGPILPMTSGWFGSRFWADHTGLQYEGNCYLGIGLLILAVFVLARPRQLFAAAREHRALAVIAGITAVFALSNHIYLGSHRIVAYPIPHALQWIAEQFRCPGRFSWLPMYVVVIFVLSRGCARLATGWNSLVLVVLAALQLYDVTPDWKQWRTFTDASGSSLDIAAWRQLLRQVDEVVVAPAHDCNSDRGFEIATEIEYLTSERAIPINGVYTARPSRDCDTDTAELVDFHPRPRTLYVFLPPTIAFAEKLSAAGFPCAEFSAGAVCTMDRTVIDALGWPTTPGPSPLATGAAITVADPAGRYLEMGWTSSEPDGRWTVGPIARLIYRPDGPPPAAPQIRIDATAILCGLRSEEIVDVEVGGERIGSLRFTPDSNALTPRVLAIPHPQLVATPIVEIELRPRDFRSPQDLGCRRSSREIAVKVQHVSIDDAPH